MLSMRTVRLRRTLPPPLRRPSRFAARAAWARAREEKRQISDGGCVLSSPGVRRGGKADDTSRIRRVSATPGSHAPSLGLLPSRAGVKRLTRHVEPF